MSLESQVVDVRFDKGLEQRTQSKLRMAGKWETLINYALSKDNTPVRRDGTAIYATSNGNGLIQRNDELVRVNAGVATTFTGDSTKVGVTVPGEVPYVDVSKAEVDFTSGYHDSPDVAYGDGFACYVWRDRAEGGAALGISISVVDLATGTHVVAATNISGLDATALSPRVVFNGNAFFIFYISGIASNFIACTVIATASPSVIGAGVVLVTDANIQVQNFDVCPISTGALVAFVYGGGATSVKVMAVIRTGTVPSLNGTVNPIFTNAFMATATICGLGLTQFSTNLAGVFAISVAGGNMVLNGATSDQTAAFVTVQTLLDTVVASAVAGPSHVCATVNSTSGKFIIYYDQRNAYAIQALSPLQQVQCTSVLGGVTASTVISSASYRTAAAEASGPQGPWIAGKPFRVGTSTFLPVAMVENYAAAVAGAANTVSAQNSFFLLDTTNGVAGTAPKAVVVASALYGSLGYNYDGFATVPPGVQTPCSVTALTSAGGYILAVQEQSRPSAISQGVKVTPMGLSGLSMVPRTTSGAAREQLGESAYVAGGQLGAYDGKQVMQHGFPNFPEGIVATRIATGGGAGKLTVGVHQIVAIYEWTDGAGNRHQSAPSLPVTVTVVVDSDTITVLVPTTQLAQNAGYNTSISTLTVVLYMTEAAGLKFFRVPMVLTAPTPNTTAATTVTFSVGVPNIPDTTLTGNELLYTQPGTPGTTFPNLAPGPISALAEGGGRLWYLKADQPFAWGFSQKLLPATGLQFSDSLGGTLPEASGGGVAVAMLDEKTILFGKRHIYFVAGNPPDSGGGNNGLSDPIDIQSDVGCSDARSVLGEIPEGIIFKSQQGWHMLGRDLSVKYIGSGVSAYDAYSVTSAVLMQDRKEARFTLSNGVTLVYSTLINEWSVFIYGAQVEVGYRVADAAWWPAINKYIWTSVSDGMSADTPGQITDIVGPHAAERFITIARTVFLKVCAMEGFQRVRRLYVTATTSTLGLLASTCSLVVYFNDSYTDPAVSYVVTFSTDLLAAPTAESVDFRHKIEKLQKCKSIAFEFVDQAANVNAVPLNGIQALALEVGIKKGVRKLPASQTVG